MSKHEPKSEPQMREECLGKRKMFSKCKGKVYLSTVKCLIFYILYVNNQT